MKISLKFKSTWFYLLHLIIEENIPNEHLFYHLKPEKKVVFSILTEVQHKVYLIKNRIDQKISKKPKTISITLKYQEMFVLYGIIIEKNNTTTDNYEKAICAQLITEIQGKI